MTDDEKPETETPPETPPEHHEEPPATPTPTGDIPEWGKELTGKVDGIIEALKPPMPADGEVIGDQSPVRPPWHKRGHFGKGE